MKRQSRRAFLRLGGAFVGGATAVTPVTAQTRFDGWFDDVSNYDGIHDRTGRDIVTVDVGVQANGGSYGFGPAAVRITPGATIEWQWTGRGGAHSIVHEGNRFESDPYSTAGQHFAHTFQSEGVYKYFCRPHKPLGMKGAIVVGDALSMSGGGAGGGGGDGSTPGGPTSTGGGDSHLPIVGSLSPVSALVGGLVVGVLGGGVGVYLWRGRQTSGARTSTATSTPTTPQGDTARQPPSRPDDTQSAPRGQQTAGTPTHAGQSPPTQDAQPPDDQTATPADNTPSDASVTCPQCDATLSPATDYCPSCGQPLD